MEQMVENCTLPQRQAQKGNRPCPMKHVRDVAVENDWNKSHRSLPMPNQPPEVLLTVG